MPTLLDHLAARLAAWHARRVFARFERSLATLAAAQQRALAESLSLVRDSDFGRRYDLARVRTMDDLRRAVPLTSYEDLRPYIDRVVGGDTGALFRPGQPLLMFATSSGTTSRRKLIPVTPQFVREYRRGWNTFGLKMLTDHPSAILRPIFQSSGRYDESHSPAGVPIGAITGLLARMQKGIVRRYYVGTPQIAAVSDARARYYTLVRFGIVRDVAFAITANPATLIRIAQVADEESERLIRDVHDGTLSRELVTDDSLRKALETRLRPNPPRAAELSRIRARTGRLAPRDYWNLVFVACWTGGSLGHYLPRMADWWGPLPVRDVGLLASEGRVTIPLDDGTPAGVLDPLSAAFEFIPADQTDAALPEALLPHELEPGRDYAVVLTNTAGLIRYRLDDVVRVHGYVAGAPLLEFRYRAGRVSSLAGEKLTENQVVEAMCVACRRLGREPADFLLAARWGDPPFYELRAADVNLGALGETLDAALARINDEYASRRESDRLGPLVFQSVGSDFFTSLDRLLLASRGSTPEQYKRPSLLSLEHSDRLLSQLPAPTAR